MGFRMAYPETAGLLPPVQTWRVASAGVGSWALPASSTHHLQVCTKVLGGGGGEAGLRAKDSLAPSCSAAGHGLASNFLPISGHTSSQHPLGP